MRQDIIHDGWAMELWPQPKIGDKFSIVMDVRENWLLEFLRQLKLRRKPRETKTVIHTITQIAQSEWEALMNIEIPEAFAWLYEPGEINAPEER